jgi:leader peptidase (prepilin peptidase)/N-methyltransferase
MSLLPLWFLAVFLVGLAAGSFINFCASRLPYERSLLWPGPRCQSCWQRIRMVDCLPVVSFLVLKGRCRTCGGRIPWSYPVVELTTALLFVGLLALLCGLVELPVVGRRWRYSPQDDPLAVIAVFAHHATLIGLLYVATLCDLADMEIPLPLTLGGTLIGLVFATAFPWPFPEPVNLALRRPYPGVYPWPVWYPLPAWLPAGSWQLGLATGLAGALAGMVLLRGVRFLFGLGRGLEGMGVGDADLMMMAGAFVGWQPVLVAFFVSVLPGLVFAVLTLIIKGQQMLPFGPALAVGVILTLLYWPMLGVQVQPLFFLPFFLGVVVIGGSMSLLLIAFLLRLMRPPVEGS